MRTRGRGRSTITKSYINTYVDSPNRSVPAERHEMSRACTGRTYTRRGLPAVWLSKSDRCGGKITITTPSRKRLVIARHYFNFMEPVSCRIIWQTSRWCRAAPAGNALFAHGARRKHRASVDFSGRISLRRSNVTPYYGIIVSSRLFRGDNVRSPRSSIWDDLEKSVACKKKKKKRSYRIYDGS